MSKKGRYVLVATLVAVIGSVASRAQAADLKNGRAIVESHNCAACHGATLNDPVNSAYPKIAGQHADYIYFALRSYKSGGLGTPNSNALLGRKNAVMAAQVQGLSDQDMLDVAAYIQSLPGDLVTKK